MVPMRPVLVDALGERQVMPGPHVPRHMGVLMNANAVAVAIIAAIRCGKCCRRCDGESSEGDEN